MFIFNTDRISLFIVNFKPMGSIVLSSLLDFLSLIILALGNWKTPFTFANNSSVAKKFLP